MAMAGWRGRLDSGEVEIVGLFDPGACCASARIIGRRSSPFGSGDSHVTLPGITFGVTVQVPRSPRAILLDKSCGIGYLMVDECTASRPAGERSGKGNRATSPGVGR